MNLHHAPLAPVLMAALSPDAPKAPEWIHLLPARSGEIQTDDSRGPYSLADADAVIAASFAGTDRLPIDQDHATDLAAPLGNPAPARGWIVAMEAREDGVWGKVEWTGEGARLVIDRAYRSISPVILHAKDKTIAAILRASLVNRPNFKGLAALNSAQEDVSVTFMEKLAKALGLEAGASEEAVLAAIGKSGKSGAAPEADAAMQASLQSAQTAVTALQSQVAELTTSLNARDEADRRGRATVFIDGAIRDKRAGLNAATRDYFVSLHMADPAKTEAAIASMPQLGRLDMPATAPLLKDGEIALNAAQLDAAGKLGISPETYAATLKAEAAKEQN